MKLNELLEFRKDLYFEGAVQVDWFYNKEKSKKVAENFVFHGKKYFGIDESIGNIFIDTVSFVKAIGEKINNDNINPLSLAIADYGTGKSHLAVTLAQLLSGINYMPETFQKIIENIAKIDAKESNEIHKIYKQKNLVLIINGMKDFNLHSELLKAAQKALQLHGISDEKLRKINRSIETAEIFFERNFKLFEKSFENVAIKYGWSEKEDDLYNKIKYSLLSDDVAFEIINEVYEFMTGHKIRWDEGLSATNILEELASDYCGLNGEFDSIIILFDEFGRYLEYASGVDSGKSGDSALQQMFECSQNLEGRLHIINFIQSDIKTYLQRVDNTKNISRYIGRYDISDKYYISSNLETVFANLIYRKENQLFENYVIYNQTKLEEEWHLIFNKLNLWCSTNGIWADYSLFRKIIVEGIYPMHPISTFMLSQLSDYLQNRSSLTLISQYINNYSDHDLSDQYFSILPEELMKGDLFTEMLSAEQEGKQASQYCIRYYNVLRKFEDKLEENHLKILRSNLVLRILRCRTSSLDDVIFGLSVCSGLKTDIVKQALLFLENEYGVLGYDDRACCFDFMEESNGAHDYKIIKKRLLATAEFDPYLLRNNQEILQLTGDDLNVETNFGALKHISSIEWQFKQQLYTAEDLTEKMIDNYVHDWLNAKDPDKPKGQLLWIYVSKNTSYETITNLQELSKKTKGSPIYLMLLNDTDNRLKNDLIEFSVLKSMDDTVKEKYARHYKDDINQNQDRIKVEFNNLKKERAYVTEFGIQNFNDRLSKDLSKVFDTLYPNAVSFNFDGLISAKKNIAPKANKNFFQIVGLILSNDLNMNSIHNQQIEIRNRIDALLYYRSNTSWKCLNEEYHIVPPEEIKSREVYDLLVNRLDKDGIINCKDIFNLLTSAPFGLNTYSFILMISIFLANLDYCTRIVYNENTYNMNAWRNLIFVKEGKVELDIILHSSFIKIDAGLIEEKFVALFKKIDYNRDVDRVEMLSNSLKSMINENQVPERLEDALKLAESKLNNGKLAKDEWNRELNNIRKLDSDMNEKNLYPGLHAIDLIQKTSFENIFSKYKYKFSELYRSQITNIKEDIIEYIEENFDEYLNNTRCNEVERIAQFRSRGKSDVKLLNEIGLNEYASVLQDHIDLEVENIEKIKDKQNLKKDCDKFFKKCVVNKYTTFIQIKEFISENNRLIDLYNRYKAFLGKDAVRIKDGLIKYSEILKDEYDSICAEIGDIFDSLYELHSVSEIHNLIDRCNATLKRGLPDQDAESLNDLIIDLNKLSDDLDVLETYMNDRSLFIEKSQLLLSKYIDTESDISYDIVELLINDLKEKMDMKEQIWITRYLNVNFTEDPEIIYRWIEDTDNLPGYLSDITKEKYKSYLKIAEQKISENRVKTAKHYFDILSGEEKERFLALIQSYL